MTPNRRPFPGPAPRLIPSPGNSSTSSTCSSLDSQRHLSLSLAELFLSEQRQFGQIPPRRSPSPPKSPVSQQRRSSAVAAALGLPSPHNSVGSSSTGESILSEGEIRRRLLAIGGRMPPNGEEETRREEGIGRKSVGTNTGGEPEGGESAGRRASRGHFGREGGGAGHQGKGTGAGGAGRGGLGQPGLVQPPSQPASPLPPPNPMRKVQHFPGRRVFRQPHPILLAIGPNCHVRSLLSKSAFRLPSLFGFSIGRPGEDGTGHLEGGRGGEGGGGGIIGGGPKLVRKRSFSRKSLLVPDRVPAGRRRSSAVVPRRRPPWQVKMAAKRAAQPKMAKLSATERPKTGHKQQPSKPPGVDVDWTHVPRLKLKFLKRKVAKEKVEGGAGTGGKALEMGQRRDGQMEGPRVAVAMGTIARQPGKCTSMAIRRGKGKKPSRRRMLCPAPAEPLIQPVDRSKTGKSRALKPISSRRRREIAAAAVENPPLNKQFLLGKAPELFSKPIFLDSPKLLRRRAK